MAEQRTRTQNNQQIVSGSFKRFPIGSWLNATVAVGEYRDMTDVVGNRDGANPMSLRISTFRPQYFDGEIFNMYGEKIREYEMYPLDTSPPVLPHPDTQFGAMSFNRLQALGWELMAAVNPSAPDVSVPQYMAEMKDWGELPRQLKEARGPSFMKKFSTLTLAYEWGVKPLISDIRKMCQFIDNVEKRRRLLDSLAEGKTIRRKRSLGSDSAVVEEKDVLEHSRSYTLRANVRTVSTTKVWGSVSYKLSSTTSLPSSDSEKLALARRLCRGFTSWGAVELAWELLPWSWLADWFSSFGDSIKALNNTVPITWTPVCIMRDSTCRRERTFTTEIPATVRLIGNYDREVRYKQRFLTFPVVPFALRMPVITQAKWSILGSLSILKLAKS